MKKVGTALTVLVATLLVATWFVLPVISAPIEQPLAFNHNLHLEEVGAECADCHLYALTGKRATIPNLVVCGDCHEDAITDSEEEARLVEYVLAAEPIPWRKIYSVPDHVYFSHRRHATVAAIECESCHGPITERTTPIVAAATDMTMEWCIACHQETGVPNDCVLCHQ